MEGVTHLPDHTKGPPLLKDEHLTYVDKYAFELLSQDDPELAKLLEHWSRSYYDRNSHLQQLFNYNRSLKSVYDCTHPDKKNMLKSYEIATHYTNEWFNTYMPEVSSLNVITDLNMIRFDSSTSAGWGYMGHKGENNNLHTAIKRCRKYVGEANDNNRANFYKIVEYSTPYIGYTRTQLTDLYDKLKVRLTWGCPFHQVLGDSCTAQPWQEVYTATNSFYFIGEDPITSVPRLIENLHADFEFVMHGDFSSLDQTAKNESIRLAFARHTRKTTFPNQPSETAHLICVDRFINKKVSDPWGRIFSVASGIPSGNVWTQIIDTHDTRDRFLTGLHYSGVDIFDRNMVKDFEQGDDHIAGLNKFPDLDKYEEICTAFDWPVNRTKFGISKNVDETEFLQRKSKGGFNQRDLLRCKLLACLTEYPQEDPEITAFRLDQIAKDCGGLCEPLNTAARIAKARYAPNGLEHIIPPRHFKRYIPGIGFVGA
jgi:hypothetical protein